MDKKIFKAAFLENLSVEPSTASAVQLHNALADTLMQLFADNWNESRRSPYNPAFPPAC